MPTKSILVHLSESGSSVKKSHSTSKSATFSFNNLPQQFSGPASSQSVFFLMENCPRHECREERQHLSKSRPAHEMSAAEEVNLAAASISLNVRLRSSDMPVDMQHRALRFTRSLVDSTPKTLHPNPTHLARAIKKEFDLAYGPAWQCVIGKSFGSFVTHSPGGFIYFSIDSLSVLLFKTEVQLVDDEA